MADKVAIGLCLAAAAYCVCGASLRLHRVSVDVAALDRINPAEPQLSGTGFAQNKMYPLIIRPRYTGTVHLYGSWAAPVPSAGAAHTTWYKAPTHFAIFFAGYPDRRGNQLLVEVQTAKAGLIRLPIPRELIPGEAWWLKSFSLSEDQQPLRMRIVAVAVGSDSQGWLGFSEPFVIRSVDKLELSKQVLLFFLAAAAASVAFLSPGFMLRQKRRHLHFIWTPFPGILLLAFVGLVAWLGPTFLSPRLISRVGLFLLIGIALYHCFRFPLSTYTSKVERRALFVFLLLVFVAGAKSIYSPGPVGELYAGRISRTLEVGARSDSRIPYHAVQLVRYRQSHVSAMAAGFFSPWSFSDRGPVPGLAVVPLVLFGRVQVPWTMPDQPWSPYDPEGFAAYRISMIVLACCGLLTVFGLATLFMPEDWALFAFLVAVTAPFTIHDIYFTWPKLAAAGFVLLAAYLVFRGRYLFSGFMLGLGYLVHPSALMSIPALAGIIILETRKNSEAKAWMARSFAMAAGVAAFILFWSLINLGHNHQGIFLTYFKGIPGRRPNTPAGWLYSRLDSALNTLVPLNLFVFHRRNLDVNSFYAFSPPVVVFFLQYWNTLPFGAGIAFFLLALLRLLYLGYRNARPWFVVLIVIPLALFIIYWGWSSAGALREGLHAWFLALMIFAVVIWHRFLRRSELFFRLANWALLFRGVEMFCLLLLPTIASQHVLVEAPFVLSDVIALVAMAVGTVWLYVYLFRRAEQLRTRSITAS